MVSITKVSSWLGITQKVLGHLAPMKDINEIPEEAGAVVAGIILRGKKQAREVFALSYIGH